MNEIRPSVKAVDGRVDREYAGVRGDVLFREEETMDMTCVQYWELMVVDAVCGKELDRQQYADMEAHLAGCATCKAKVEAGACSVS